MQVDLKQLLLLPVEDRQFVQEIVGFSIVNDMKLLTFAPEQQKQIEERAKQYCKKATAVFKFEDVKAAVLDKFQ